MAIEAHNPFLYIADPTKGRPLFNAELYYGIPDLDPEILANQVQVSVIQENGTVIDIPQPVETGAGGVPLYNGSPVVVCVAATEYSFKALNKQDSQTYYNPLVKTKTNAADVNFAFDTLASGSSSRNLQDATNIVAGMIVTTTGYNNVDDGGGNSYIIGSGFGAADGGSIIDLPGSGLQAMGLFQGGIVNNVQFGSSESSSTNQINIQAAIDYVGQSGGTVTILPGIWEVSGVIEVTTGVAVKGSGRSNATSPETATRILSNHNDDVFLITGSWGRVSDLTITHSGAPAAGNAVHMYNVADPSIENIYIVGTYNGVLCYACNTPVVDNVQCINCVGVYHFKTEGDAIVGNSDSHLFRNISGGFIGAGPAGFRHIVHGNFTNSGKTIGFRCVRGDFGVVCEGITDDPDDIWFTQGGCDNQEQDAFRFTSGQQIFLTDVWAGQAVVNGMVFTSNFTGNLTAKGVRVRGSGEHGIVIAGGSVFSFSDSLVGQNGVDLANTFSGLSASAGDSITISGGTFGTLASGGANQQRFGIVLSGSVENVRVTGANLAGNVTAGFASTSSGTDIRVSNCIGHITENYDSTQVTLTGAIGTISHGLDSTPASAVVVLSGSAEDDRFVFDVTADATDISFSIWDVSSAAALVSGTHQLQWMAKAKY